MNPVLKQEWIDRLLSDDYQQCRGGLRKIVGDVVYNDVWGVLLDIVADDAQFQILERHDGVYYFAGGPNMRVLPSYQLMEALGIPYNAGPSADIRNYLAGLNDSGSNFIYIAGEIQEYVPSE